LEWLLVSLLPTSGLNSELNWVLFARARLQNFIQAAYTLHMDRRVLALGVTVEILASLLAVLLTPSDIHPTIRAFLIEHALLWAFTFAALIRPAIATLGNQL
jgi:hypothetical protein